MIAIIVIKVHKNANPSKLTTLQMAAIFADLGSKGVIELSRKLVIQV